MHNARTQTALRFLELHALVAAAGFAAAVWLAGPTFLLALAFGSPAAVVFGYYDLTQADCTLQAEVAASIVLGVVATAMAVLGARAVPAVIYVRARLRLAMVAAQIDFLVSSANKCIGGMPGFSYAIACAGYARSLSLDLVAQYLGLEGNGQFRFTPPTHTLLAFHQALLELEAEGGVAGCAARYRRTHAGQQNGIPRSNFQASLRQAARM